MARDPFTDEVPDPLDSVCGWCGRAVALTRLSRVHEVRSRDSGPHGQQTILVAASYLCPRNECNRPSLVFCEIEYSTVFPDSTFHFDGVVGALPAGTAVRLDGLPPEIERDRQEAWRSFYGGNLRAAIIMGRAAIQRSVRTLDAEGAGLKREITDLVQRGKITEDLGRFAHEVRIAGDDAAHPDELGDVTREEAKESLDFLDDFLRVTIAMPALAKVRREARRETETRERE